MAEFAGERSNQSARRDRYHAKRDLAVGLRALVRCRVLPGGCVGDQRAGARQHALAEFGQHHAAPGAVEQPAADAALQRRHLAAERRLRHAGNGRASRVAAIGGDFDKRPELPDVHEAGYAILVILIYRM